LVDELLFCCPGLIDKSDIALQVVGRWSLVVGRWSLVVGRWSLVVGRWSLVVGRWSLVVGRWSKKYCGLFFFVKF
jgi:formate dehydrogenase subunit delta